MSILVSHFGHLFLINKFSASSLSSTLIASSPETKLSVFLHLSSPVFSYPAHPKKTPLDEFLITIFGEEQSGQTRFVVVGLFDLIPPSSIEAETRSFWKAL